MRILHYDGGMELSPKNLPPVWIHGSILFLVMALTLPIWLKFSSRGIATGSVVACGIVLSIFIHEAAHAWTAMKLGHRVTLIRLHVSGGETLWETSRYSRRDDCLITLAGPVANLCVGLLGLLLYYTFFPDPTVQFTPSPDRPWFRPPPTSPPFMFPALFWIAVFNLVLTFINLLPAFPLDGGRLLHNFLEGRYGLHRALFWTGLLGTVLAVISKFVFVICILGGLVVWSPPEFHLNYSAMQAGRQKRPWPEPQRLD